MKTLLDKNQLNITLQRLAHQLVENHLDFNNTAIIGIQPRGILLSDRIAELVKNITGKQDIDYGKLDITFYRDDLSKVAGQPLLKSTDLPNDLPFPLESSTLVIVDDVLYTGRTVRAALDALVDVGRPKAVRLAVLVDRGHRELPIRADHVGKNVPTSRDEVIKVHLRETDGGDDEVVIERRDESGSDR